MGKKEKPGPKPNHLKIDSDNWETAIQRAIKKERPPEGWPDKKKKKKS